MLNLNRVELIGNVTRDPEIKGTGNGRMAIVGLATSERWKDAKTGDRKEKTEFHRLIAWNPKTVDFLEKHLAKGDYVRVVGKLVNRSWEDEGTGETRYAVEIHIREVSFLQARDHGDDGVGED